jgi:hypothetical protein
MAVAFVIFCSSAQAHLMVAQKGTLHLQGDGAYLVVSLPVSAFSGIDDDGDGAWSNQEVAAHEDRIHQQLRAQLRLRDAQGPRPIDGITLVPTPSDDLAAHEVNHLVVLVRFKLAQPVESMSLTRVPNMAFRAGLFGQSEAERKLSIAVTQGAHKQLMVLTPERPERTLFPSPGQVTLDYAELGVMHILTGWDHLLFLAVVLLGGGSWRQILVILSAFTFGHALTLAWGLMGQLPFGTAWVEPGIALTVIGMAAAEIWLLQHGRVMGMTLRLVLVWASALVHGLGLASSLQAIGLDSAHRFWSLLGFNLGIELAQAAVVGGLGGLAWLVMRYLQVRQTLKIRQLCLVFSAGAGCIWFVERLI